MNVPKEIPTTSQMICLLVSHTIELCFELCASSPELGASPSKPACRLPKVKAQSAKDKAQTSKFYPHPRQHARLPFDLGSNFADTRRAHSLIETFSIRIG